jgi:hypothetical protein
MSPPLNPRRFLLKMKGIARDENVYAEAHFCFFKEEAVALTGIV